MVRLRALVGLKRRIEVSALHDPDRARDVAVTGVPYARQGDGNVLKERIPVLHRQ
jgi:hypothetical protein